MADLLLINTILPFRYLHAQRQKSHLAQAEVLEYYMQLAAERNVLTEEWVQLGVSVKNAFDTQALLHLRKNYCTMKRCLDCAIGNTVLKR